MYSRFCPCLLQLVRVCKVRERENISIFQILHHISLLQEIITMPDANLVKSTTYLFDCFVDDYYDEKYCHMMTDLDMRAQVEVNIPIYISLMRRDEIVEILFPGLLLLLLHLGDGLHNNDRVSRMVQRSVQSVDGSRVSDGRENTFQYRGDHQSVETVRGKLAVDGFGVRLQVHQGG